MKKIWRITLLTNPDVCNLRCKPCFLRQRKVPFGMGEMPWEIAEKAVRTYASQGLREVIPSTMGEPLLYSQFEKLERLVSDLNLKLNITTNGSFPRKGVERWARELLPIASDIKVSCWGAKKNVWKILCPGMDVGEYWRNLETLVRVREELSRNADFPSASLTLQMAVSKTNRRDVDEVLARALVLGFDRVKFNRTVFLYGSPLRGDELPFDDFWDASMLRDLPIRIEGTFFRKPGEDGGLEACPFFGKELWILPDGSTEPCPDPEARYGSRKSGNRCERCLLFPRRAFSER